VKRILGLLALALCSFLLDRPAVAASGDLLWTYATGAPVWAPPTFAGGVLYVANDKGELIALDLATRSPRWTFRTAGAIRAKPAVSADAVYVAGDDGFVHAIDPASGAEHWRFDLVAAGLSRRAPSPDTPFFDYLQSSPLVHDGRVYVGSINGMMFALDAASGREVWRTGTLDSVRGSPVVAGDSLYFGSWDDHVYAVELATGKLKWRSDTGGIVQSTPVVAEGRVIVGSRSAALVALDAQSGKEMWRYAMPGGSWVESSPIQADDTLYVGSSDALSASAIRAADGTRIWETPLGGWAWATPRLSGNSLYVGTISASPYYGQGVTLRRGLHALDVRTGAEKWRFVPGGIEAYISGGFAVAPEVVDGIVYAPSVDGTVYALAE
jgi:outer membrane protein assembly factor BamB